MYRAKRYVYHNSYFIHVATMCALFGMVFYMQLAIYFSLLRYKKLQVSRDHVSRDHEVSIP